MSKEELMLSLHVLMGEWQRKYREEVRIPHNDGRVNLLSACMEDVQELMEEYDD